MTKFHPQSISLSSSLLMTPCNIFFKRGDISELCNTVDRALSLVAYWFKGNQTLDPDKTIFILFHPSRKQINLDHSIFIDGNKITRVE